ncbi:MAG: 4-hydroxy-3-methylbut-2-enyl diphosphate reductase [Bacteroidales bacterium]|nr:4-hydroxy-3-methylbut-2-enyl diphosphate reductase [Candidatus Hennigimonas equi]
MKVEIDSNSGFCGGVIRAIKRAEDFLAAHPCGNLYSLGAIVHNDSELERLRSLGLQSIDYETVDNTDDASGKTVLVRAHGEPPSTYEKVKRAGFDIVDCTCPVVLELQRSIRQAYACAAQEGAGRRIIIFGQIGHAETLGLLGQVDGDAVVIESISMFEDYVAAGKIDVTKPVEIFSQTTKSPSDYAELCARLGALVPDIKVHNTICTQVASRQKKLSEFASSHDVIVFVSGRASSNGKILSALCRQVNPRSYHIESASELRADWFRPDDSVGVCGATSTPRWLLEDVASKVLEIG